MKKNIKNQFEAVINELNEKVKANPGDSTYTSMLKQIEFVYTCEQQGKDLVKELGNRRLNFAVIASKNLSGPEETLKEQISEINLYILNKQ